MNRIASFLLRSLRPKFPSRELSMQQANCLMHVCLEYHGARAQRMPVMFRAPITVGARPARQRPMQMRDSGSTQNLDETGQLQPTPSHHIQPSTSELAELCNRLGTREHIRFAARGQEAIDAGANHVFQGFSNIRRLVKGPMESDLHGFSQRHQLTSSFHVDATIRKENAYRHSSGSRGFRLLDLNLHLAELGRREYEIPGAWPNQHIDRNRKRCNGLGHQVNAWRYSADRKLGAKLDSIGASAFSRACCLDGRYTQLKERNFHGKDTCFPVT